MQVPHSDDHSIILKCSVKESNDDGIILTLVDSNSYASDHLGGLLINKLEVTVFVDSDTEIKAKVLLKTD